jgi:adenylylsulfate kinase
VREKYNDWDFSVEGRVRQAHRMRELADAMTAHFVLCDFICPLPEMRTAFGADFTVWVDTITTGRFEDTNRMFTPPTDYDLRITEQDAPRYSELVADTILAKYLHVDLALSS